MKDSNEFRKGNIVDVDYGSMLLPTQLEEFKFPLGFSEVRRAKVESVFDDGINVDLCSVDMVYPIGRSTSASYGTMTWTQGKWIRPVKLTEKWMKKLGFENIDDEIDFSEWQNEWVLVYGNGSDGQEPFRFNYSLNETGDDVSVELLYVHQLQNLFFDLTGKELLLPEENYINSFEHYYLSKKEILNPQSV